jgi:DMSO/TMAO reductase YedYZ molybdopterin-dependent catalytic subunit
MIEITDKKVEKLSEHIEEGLRSLGKAMQCVEQMMQEGGMGEREGMPSNRGGGYGSRYGNRGYGERMGYRDEDEDEDWGMQERRRRDTRGRYM